MLVKIITLYLLGKLFESMFSSTECLCGVKVFEVKKSFRKVEHIEQQAAATVE